MKLFVATLATLLVGLTAAAPNIVCPLRNEDVLLPNPKDCRTYYVCTNGVLHLMACPRGLEFNREEGICDWVERARCRRSNLVNTHILLRNEDPLESRKVREPASPSESTDLARPTESSNSPLPPRLVTLQHNIRAWPVTRPWRPWRPWRVSRPQTSLEPTTASSLDEDNSIRSTRPIDILRPSRPVPSHRPLRPTTSGCPSESPRPTEPSERTDLPSSLDTSEPREPSTPLTNTWRPTEPSERTDLPSSLDTSEPREPSRRPTNSWQPTESSERTDLPSSLDTSEPREPSTPLTNTWRPTEPSERTDLPSSLDTSEPREPSRRPTNTWQPTESSERTDLPSSSDTSEPREQDTPSTNTWQPTDPSEGTDLPSSLDTSRSREPSTLPDRALRRTETLSLVETTSELPTTSEPSSLSPSPKTTVPPTQRSNLPKLLTETNSFVTFQPTTVRIPVRTERPWWWWLRG